MPTELSPVECVSKKRGMAATITSSGASASVRRPKTAIMGVEVGRKIKFSEVVKPLLCDWQRSEAQVCSITYPGCVTVCVGSVVEILSPGDEQNWFLYVTSVQTVTDCEVTGYFFYNDRDVRIASGAYGFKSPEVFITHERFTAPLSSVLRVRSVLPVFMESDAQEEGDTLYYHFFWDSEANELRPIDFQLSLPWHLLEFLAHNAVVASGGGDRDVCLFKKNMSRGLREFCERWRTKSTNPKRGVKVQVDVDLQQLLCLPFSILEMACFQTEEELLILHVERMELDGLLGEKWNEVEMKARRVEDGEILRFVFSGDAQIRFNWGKQECAVKFNGVHMYNGAGVLQWSTNANGAFLVQGWISLY